jgi:putative aminopeptidase FrvX
LFLLLMLQAPDPALLAVRLAAMTAVTGYEQRMVDTVVSLLPGAIRDRAGNAILKIGSGAPARLVACPLDEPGYVVGGIRDDGYLTLHRVPGRTPPLADQQLEGQRVTVWGRKGGVPAVVAVRSTHLTRGRTGSEAPFTADAAYVDLGAATAADVAAAGLGPLDAVALAKRPQRYGDSLLAAPVAGRRASCAALIAAARGARTAAPAAGTTIVAFTVEQNLSARGLLTAMHEYGPFTRTLLVEPDSTALRSAADLGDVRRERIATRYAGTPVETVSLSDAARLAVRLRQWIGGGQ